VENYKYIKSTIKTNSNFIQQNYKHIKSTIKTNSNFIQQNYKHHDDVYDSRYKIQHGRQNVLGSFNMDWRILVFYPEPEARDKIY
jgi:Ni,Fe-hydrogenase I large subunit